MAIDVDIKQAWVLARNDTTVQDHADWLELGIILESIACQR